MPRVSLVDNAGTALGSTSYDTYVISGETRHWYNQDKWQYVIDRMVFVCTAWKEILTVDGYLPHLRWRRVEKIDLPSIAPNKGFVIEEPFDATGRTGGEALEYSTEWSPGQRIVHVRFGEQSKAEKVYISPHEGLLLGARLGPSLELSDLLFVDVEGLTQLARDQSTQVA